MRYFNYLSGGDRTSLFSRQCEPFYKTTDRDTLRGAVGGLLYTPGVNQAIASTVVRGKVRGLSSMAICLEDAVGDREREGAMENTASQLHKLHLALSDGTLARDALPLLFVRVKDADMLERMADVFVEYSDVLTGAILPKVCRADLERYMKLVADIDARARDPFYAMPILESAELMLCGDRIGLLREFKTITDRYYDRVLNMRVGATDLCGLYGIRRGPDTPIYSVTMVANCIADVVRVFGAGDSYTISGPVWEYYTTTARARATGNWGEISGLMREVYLDQQNGVCGKTCVHPTQLLPVQAGYVVPFEVYNDAATVLEGDQGRLGVLPSARQNKMNELKPHALWAAKILRQADVFGVFQEGADARGLLRAVYQGNYSL